MTDKVVSKNISVTVNNKPVEVHVTLTAVLESNYGADADGNRGWPVWFVEDICYDVPDTDINGSTLTDEEKQAVADLVELDTENWDLID